MDVKSRIFLNKKFKRYYWDNTVSAPSEVSTREFGVGTLDDKIKSRHKSFKTEKELNDYLKREAPFFISYSAAYYEFPSNQPMDAKNWDGADLVFDLDTDMKYLNQNSMEKVKKQTQTLKRFLLDDFGFSEANMSVNFSGGKGYHIHILSDDVKNLRGEERREIINYITATGLDLKFFLIEKEKGERHGPKKGDPGWAGRLYDAAFNVISERDPEKLKQIPGIGDKTARQLIKDRETNIKSLERGRWDGPRHFEENVKEKAIEDYAVTLLGDTDRMVTLDTSRIMRLPDTLHGGTGLKAAKVKDLDRFDPLVDAIVFGSEKVSVKFSEKIPEFDLGGEIFGPFEKDSNEEVPEYTAIYLMLKGCALLA